MVTIKGYGFNPKTVRNAVYLSVPVSTTFPNGIVVCDVVESSATEIKCKARQVLDVWKIVMLKMPT